ncbi:MAG: PIN domain-containing protein [Gammaproteobacteria bacterium]|nr:PIN domain-containing protein [Gammaproteobacteria bacterium]
MRVIFDTNVVLDVLLDREPFAGDAAHLFASVEREELDACLCATTITTIHYLASKALGSDQARILVKKLLSLFEIAPVNRPVLESAEELGFTDFEDAVLHEAARHVGVQAIVTRDPKGFAQAALPIYTPDLLLKALKSLG